MLAFVRALASPGGGVGIIVDGADNDEGVKGGQQHNYRLRPQLQWQLRLSKVGKEGRKNWAAMNCMDGECNVTANEQQVL